MDDFQLLEAYAARNAQDSFTELVRRHVDMVHATALRQVGDAHLAEDIAQAVFLILAQKANKIRNQGSLAGWLFKTTRYAAANALKMKRRVMYYEKQAALSKAGKPRQALTRNTWGYESNKPHRIQCDSASPGTGPRSTGDSSSWEVLTPHLNEAVATLGTRDRNAVLLRYFEGNSLAEVAAALAVTEAAAKMRLSRAVGKLRKFLKRKGVVIPIVALGTLLQTEAAVAAPIGLAAAAVTGVFTTSGAAGAVVTGVSATTGAASAASATGVTGASGAAGAVSTTSAASSLCAPSLIAKGAIKMMMLAKLKAAAVVTVAALAVGGAAPVVVEMMKEKAPEKQAVVSDEIENQEVTIAKIKEAFLNNNLYAKTLYVEFNRYIVDSFDVDINNTHPFSKTTFARSGNKYFRHKMDYDTKDNNRERFEEISVYDGNKYSFYYPMSADGTILNDGGSCFNMQTLPIPFLTRIWDQFAYLRVQEDELTLLPEKEYVDGNLCYVILGKEAKNLNLMHYKLYLDPTIGLMPRRVDGIANRNFKAWTLTSVKRLSNYKEIAPGQWYPMRVEEEGHQGDGIIFAHNLYISRILRVNEPLSDEFFNFEYPAGTRVYNDETKSEFTVGVDDPETTQAGLSKAVMMELVEGYFRHNFRDITSRETIEWGEVTVDDEGNSSIRYKANVTIWDKDKMIMNIIFTFDENQEYVSHKNVEGFPQTVAEENPVVISKAFYQAILAGDFDSATKLYGGGSSNFPQIRDNLNLEEGRIDRVWVDRTEACAVTTFVSLKRREGKAAMGLSLRKVNDRWIVRDGDFLFTPQKMEEFITEFKQRAPQASEIKIEQQDTKPEEDKIETF